MDFTPSDEQRMIADTIGRFAEAAGAIGAARGGRFGFSEETWRGLAETGLLGLNVTPERGGIGGAAVDNLVAFQALGRAALLAPVLSSAVLGAKLLQVLGTAEQQDRHLPLLADGRLRLALAHLERSGRYDLVPRATVARRTAGGWVLRGEKVTVHDAPSATLIAVTAAVADGGKDPHLAVFLVPPDGAGVELRAGATLDGRGYADIVLDDVLCADDARLGATGAAPESLEHVLDWGTAALCFDAVGAMETLLRITTDYVKTRRQFGQALASFQAVQHRLADMASHLEQARSICLHAAAHLDDGDRVAAARAVSAAKVMVGEAARHVGQQAVQLHGAIGITEELAVGRYFKRLTCFEMTLGDAEHHIRRFTALDPAAEPPAERPAEPVRATARGRACA